MKNIKKIIIVIFMLMAFISIKEVSAETFRAAEFVNVYRNKEKDGVVISSRRERMIREATTGELAYCIEPYGGLIDNYVYENEYSEYSTNLNMTEEEYNRVLLLAYYGYNYGNHTNPEWYSITQILIWRTIDKASDFYWVEFPNKARIDVYESEIAELENLVEEHSKRATMNNIEGRILGINKEYSIEEGNTLNNYNIINSDDNIEVSGGNIIIRTTEAGKKQIELEEKVNLYTENAKMYLSDTSQDLIKVGNYRPKKEIINYEVKSGSIKIRRIDKDTNTTTPSGNASLVGAVYGLYNENNEQIDELIIDSDSTTTKTDLPFGKYKLKEIQSSTGYYIDEKEYEFEINEEKLFIEIDIESKVINSKILLHKYYGNEENWKNEVNIVFYIYDELNKLYKEIKTNNNGIAETYLPYGKYKLVQINTTDNYQVVNSFELVINEESGSVINCDLYDLEIETPNTGISENIIVIHFFKRKEYD